MPRLLQINALCNWGSTGRIAEQIGQLAINKGWEVWIAHGGRYVNNSVMETIQTESKYADYWHFLWNSFLLGHHGLGSKTATKKLVKQIKSIDPDIIHLHNIHGYFLNYEVLFDYLNSVNTPIVWTLHDPWPFTGHCGHFGSINCERWKTICHNCPLKMKDYPKSIIDNSKEDFLLKERLFSSNQNLHLIPVSNWLGELTRQSFLKDKDICVINNGIDIDIFSPVQYIQNDRFLILGVASQWGGMKGLNDFYELRHILDSNKYEIVLVGLSKKQIKKLPHGIRGIERTDSIKDLVSLYSAADVFVNLTYADTFPTVNIEALACGTPVITYETDGSPEIIDENTGIVVPKGNIKGIVQALYTIYRKGKRFYINACRARAVKLYNKDNRFQDYINLYNRLLNEKSGTC